MSETTKKTTNDVDTIMTTMQTKSNCIKTFTKYKYIKCSNHTDAKTIKINPSDLQYLIIPQRA